MSSRSSAVSWANLLFQELFQIPTKNIHFNSQQLALWVSRGGAHHEKGGTFRTREMKRIPCRNQRQQQAPPPPPQRQSTPSPGQVVGMAAPSAWGETLPVFTNKVSHRVRNEALNMAKSRNIPVHMCHSCGVCSLRTCLLNCLTPQ